jgi:hypothetical protein
VNNSCQKLYKLSFLWPLVSEKHFPDHGLKIWCGLVLPLEQKIVHPRALTQPTPFLMPGRSTWSRFSLCPRASYMQGLVINFLSKRIFAHKNAGAVWWFSPRIGPPSTREGLRVTTRLIEFDPRGDLAGSPGRHALLLPAAAELAWWYQGKHKARVCGRRKVAPMW